MSRHNCKGCAHFDREHGCLDVVSWRDGIPENPNCYIAVLHQHPDGAGRILHVRSSSRLIVENELTGHVVTLPIGPAGLLGLAKGLITEAEAQQ